MPNEIVPYVVDVPADFDKQKAMAISIADSDLLPAHLRKKPANVLIIIAGARALGVSWFQALQAFFVVEGKLSMSAELMRSLVVRNGHKFRILEMTDKVARVQLVRADDPDNSFTSEFTIEDAKRAELLGKTNWKRYAKAMLLARATSQAVRAYIPDVLAGNVYTPEELGARVDEDGKPLINPDGTVIIDVESTADDGVDIQTAVDVMADDIRTGTLDSATATFQMAVEKKWTHLIPNLPGQDNDASLYQLWMIRLSGEAYNVSTTVTRGEATPESGKQFLRIIWQAASKTSVINQVSGSKTVNEHIGEAVGRIDGFVATSRSKDDEPTTPAPPTEAEPVIDIPTVEILTPEETAEVIDAVIVGEVVE